MASIDPTNRDPKTGTPARGTRWKARYRDPRGKHRSRTFDRKADAERFLASTSTDIGRGDWIDPRLSRVLFSEWADAWWASTPHLRASTRKGYATALNARLRPRFDDVPIGSIDRTALKELVGELSSRGLAAKTIAHTVLVLRLVLQEAVEAGSLKENPATAMKLPRARRQEPLFLAARGEPARRRHPTALRLPDPVRRIHRPAPVRAVRPARRQARPPPRSRRGVRDAHAGRRQDGDRPHEVRQHAQRPTPPLPRRRRRRVPGRALGSARRRLEPADLVFGPIATKNGVTRTPFLYAESIRRYILKPALAEAGLPSEFRTHDLRHTCASLLISLGAHPQAIMERLGHSDINVTLNVYGHLLPSLEEQLTDGLDDLYRSTDTARMATSLRPEPVRMLR